MDIQASELAELLKLAGIAGEMPASAGLPQQELELPAAEPSMEPTMAIELPTQEPELTADDEAALQIGGQEAPCDMAQEIEPGIEERFGLNPQEPEVEEDSSFAAYKPKPAQAYSYDDPEMRDDLAARGERAFADQQAGNEFDEEERFLAMIGAKMATPNGEMMQQRGQEHTYDYETNPEDGIHNPNDMMTPGNAERVELNANDEDPTSGPDDAMGSVEAQAAASDVNPEQAYDRIEDRVDLQNGYGEEHSVEGTDYNRPEEAASPEFGESVDELESSEDMHNGYDDPNQVNGDTYGNDNVESTTNHRDDNEIAVRESEVKYQGAFNAGKKDALAGKSVSDVNVSDKYAFEGGDYLKGHAEGKKELDDKKQTESIHESLVYKYREYNG